MKLDEEVKMISAEAPIIFAKAAELFIQEVTIRAWLHTEENKRRTLQRNDVALAISKYDQFDFLIDIVPRDEIKPSKKEANSPTPAANTSSVNLQNTQVLNSLDQQTASLLNAINGGNTANTVISNQQAGGNVQYYFALPTGNGGQNGAGSSGGLPLQLQGLQNIQGLQGNLQGIQTIQGLQGLQGLQGIQGLQGAQIILNQNGQPTIFSVGNRDC